MDVFWCIHIVTYIFIIAIVCVLLHFTKNNLYIGGFFKHAANARDSSFNERCTPQQGSSPLQGHGSWLMCEVALKNCKDDLS